VTPEEQAERRQRRMTWFSRHPEFTSRHRVIADGEVVAMWANEKTAEQMANRLSRDGYRTQIMPPERGKALVA
jgi:hypothetical protein